MKIQEIINWAEVESLDYVDFAANNYCIYSSVQDLFETDIETYIKQEELEKINDLSSELQNDILRQCAVTVFDRMQEIIEEEKEEWKSQGDDSMGYERARNEYLENLL